MSHDSRKEAAKISKTSTETKRRWNAKTYKQYTISFKLAEDADIINAIEAERAAGKSAAEAIKTLIREKEYTHEQF